MNFKDLQNIDIKDVVKYYNRSASTQSIISKPEPVAKPLTASPNKSASTASTQARVKAPVKRTTKPLAQKAAAQAVKSTEAVNTKLGPVDLVLIGTSTGGPVALQKVLTALPANFSKPIALIQHMPASFTSAFAERLDSLCKIKVKLAADGDVLTPGVALLAPGGQQMMIERNKVRVIDGDERMNYRPCVDLTFASAAKHFPGKSLGVVLTGMGSDGRDGAKLMKETGCKIWAQDKETCVIYGMPMAVAKANLADAVLPLQSIGPALVKEVR